MALKLRIKEFQALIDRKIDAFLKNATLKLHEIARENASVSNKGVTIAVTRPRAGGNATSRTIYPQPSKPGESPRMRTGFGHDNIVQGYSRTLQIGRVGYTRSARYMTFQELGITYARVGKQQRPTIVPALRMNIPSIAEAGRIAAEGAR